MVSTGRKKKQNRKIRTHQHEFTDVAMETWDNHNTQTGSRVDTVDEIVASGRRNCVFPLNGSHVDMKTLERSIAYRVRSETDNTEVTVKTREHNRVLVAIYILETSRVGLATKKWSTRLVLYLAQKDRFPRECEKLPEDRFKEAKLKHRFE